MKDRGERAGREAVPERLYVFARDQLFGNLLPFWTSVVPDKQGAGFAGRVDGEGKAIRDAPVGIILNARLLWTYSEVYCVTPEQLYLDLARRAYDHLVNHFQDDIHGGYYWAVDASGSPLQDKKQTYGQAFAIFALAGYYKACRDPGVLERALALYEVVEEKCSDTLYNGYFESFSREWQYTGENRLSAKDLNECKSMNTHLHLLEAYAALLGVHRSGHLEARLRNLICIFTGRIIDPVTYRQRLFFNEKWECRSDVISYGHDIEASWLLYEAAVTLGDRGIISSVAGTCVKMAEAAMEGLNELGGLTHEKGSGDPDNGEMEWWAQAEAVTGLLNAFRLSGDFRFLAGAAGVSEFIADYVVDKQNGEWFYRLDRNGSPLPGYDKAGFWKCPYHNVRMCLEILKYYAVSSH
jgi:cellobiose epimerase